MQLIKELMSLNEAEADNEEMSPEKNLNAVDLILRADGDIPLGKGSHNQMDSLGEEDGNKMFYVAIDPPHGNVEAYVVVDKNGNFSYYDFTDEIVVINGKFALSGGSRVTSEWKDEMEDLIGEYALESGKVKEGGIKAFVELLKTAKD